ncbi:MAG: substrate-binding domain-containing protein, partial [Bacteroidetes bacterium]|nr:substrate-binding domain-containing protein [Bacteroidota bacterium]
ADEVLSFGVEVKSFTFNQLIKESYIAEFEKLIDGEPDAVIITPLFLNETKKFVKVLEEKNIPYLFLNIDIDGFNNISFIGQDSYQGGYLSGKLMHLSTGDNATYLIAQTKSKFQNNSVIERRVIGFSTYFKDHKIPFRTISLNFENLDELEMVKNNLLEVFKEHKDIKGVLVPSSRIATISKCIENKQLKKLRLIGFDTTEQNVTCLGRNEITFLISQKSFNQGFKSVKMMVDFLIQNSLPPLKVYSPIEIITKENLEFSQRNKWQYNSENK